jgi:uncharacterized protein (UPF0276 family)
MAHRTRLQQKNPSSGIAGLGFRREMLNDLKQNPAVGQVDFFEIAPENWLAIGGRFAKDLRYFTERYPFTCHGLSLSVGGFTELDTLLLKNIKRFMQTHQIDLYTEHLSWCADDGHLYDLLPIPCTEAAVKWVANRIKQAQDILGMQIGIENASYYVAPPNAEMSEAEFVSAVVKESGCFFHLDVNNVYVNSQNFNFDPFDYLQSLPLEQVGYLHVAGHYVEDDGLIVDTHGADVIDPVWTLLEQTYALQRFDVHTTPICLERDFNIPPVSDLLRELEMIRTIQKRSSTSSEVTVQRHSQVSRHV